MFKGEFWTMWHLTLVILKHMLIFSLGIFQSFQKIVGVGQIIHVKNSHIVSNVKK
jgi:hypothetical protein